MAKEVIVFRVQHINYLIKKLGKIDNKLIFINIDKTLLEDTEFIKINDVEYKTYIDNYQINIYVDEKSDWYGVLNVIDNEKKNCVYSILSTNLLLWLEGKYEYEIVYLRKWDSEAKIDEE